MDEVVHSSSIYEDIVRLSGWTTAYLTSFQPCQHVGLDGAFGLGFSALAIHYTYMAVARPSLDGRHMVCLGLVHVTPIT